MHFHYFVSHAGNRLYLSVTSRHALSGAANPFTTLFHARGPKFGMDGLPMTYEPSAEEMAEIVESVYETDPRKLEAAGLGMGESDDGVTFAGTGEPLLRLDSVAKAAQLIKERRHGVPLRLSTTGIGSPKPAEETTQLLLDAGVEHLSLFVPSTDAKQYAQVMAGQPLSGACNLSVLAAEVGINVKWVTVANKKMTTSGMQSLALSCGATELVTKPYAE